MPRTMLTDQHWQKLKVILRNLAIQTLFSNVLIVGQAAVSYLDYSNY